MAVKETVFRIIRENAYVSVPITKKSNLYTDMGFDSLSFIAMMAQIEEVYNITIDITQMEACLVVDQLIETIENKVEGREYGND